MLDWVASARLLMLMRWLACAELAAAVGHVYVVSVTHPNVQKAVDANPEKFTVAKSAGILATDEMLAAARDELNTFKLG